MAETIHPASIVEETRRRYLTYALSVITSRALPDVRDGLKPVQRRILFAMFNELTLHADRRPAKCARIIGEVTGKFHPHGNEAAYDALVRLAQSWIMRERLVDGQGNFGSYDGDAPAAYRYTEAKLTAIADHLLAELRQRTVEMRPTYNAETQEPVVLPAQFPNLLVNGSAGIAVGMATNIPPHNLSDVIDACVLLIDDRDASTANLLDKLKGPDFPLGGKIVTDRRTLRKTYEDGQGSIRVQAEWKLEEHGKKRQIAITSIPFGVNKGNLEGVIGEIIETRKLPLLTGLTNESNEKVGLRIVLDIKPDADPEMVMAYLYKHTALQENFPVNLTCLVPGDDGKPQPQRLGLKEILRHFLDFRLETVRKRFEYELEQLRKRIHILQGFKIVFNDLDRAIKIIRNSDGKADAAEKLMQVFRLDEIQVEAILDAQLYRLAQLEIKRILDELREKKKQAEEIEDLLGSTRKLWGVVKSELKALGEKYGGRRRTSLAMGEETPEFSAESYIVKENTNVVLTRDGWIKRVGRLASVEGTRVREGDAVLAVAPGSTLDHVVFFADDGAAFTMRINEVPASSGYGEPVAKFFKLDEGAKIIAAVTTDERFVPAHTKPETKQDPPGPYLLAVTELGLTLRAPLAAYRTESNKLGRRYVKLNEGDRVVLACVLKDEKSLWLASRDGHVLHFPLNEINILSGVGKGVIGIKLADDDICLGGALIAKASDMLQVETSGGKVLEYTGRHETASRAGKGFEAVKRATLVRVLPPPIQLVDWDELEGKKPSGNGARLQLFE
ncbi:MAG: DNA topoisomerase 4 subunit A [Gemmataceae bacterium]|nr:DNA topoisomerase 4 subunit A [Gemmataceae bacterium]MCI0738250.1 DNA topoisomerase 4 subunit A [Gemmataceae bacterium]